MDSKKDLKIFAALAGVPVLLTIGLCFFFDERSTDNALNTLVIGMILLWAGYPAYYAALSIYNIARKEVGAGFCVGISLLFAAIANLAFRFGLDIHIYALSGQSFYGLWRFSGILVSLSANVIFFFIFIGIYKLALLCLRKFKARKKGKQ